MDDFVVVVLNQNPICCLSKFFPFFLSSSHFLDYLRISLTLILNITRETLLLYNSGDALFSKSECPSATHHPNVTAHGGLLTMQSPTVWWWNKRSWPFTVGSKLNRPGICLYGAMQKHVKTFQIVPTGLPTPYMSSVKAMVFNISFRWGAWVQQQTHRAPPLSPANPSITSTPL